MVNPLGATDTPSVRAGVGVVGRVVIPWTWMNSLHSDETNCRGSRDVWTLTRIRTCKCESDVIITSFVCVPIGCFMHILIDTYIHTVPGMMSLLHHLCSFLLVVLHT